MTIDRQPIESSSSRIARPSAAPSAGSVPAPISSIITSDFSVAFERISETRLTCELKVESDCSSDCSSPISTSTSSKTGNCDPSCAGICRPDCAMIPIRPTVFRATVLPPVFGPVTTRICDRNPRCTSIGTTFRGSGAGPSSGLGFFASSRKRFSRIGCRAPRRTIWPCSLKSGGVMRKSRLYLPRA